MPPVSEMEEGLTTSCHFVTQGAETATRATRREPAQRNFIRYAAHQKVRRVPLLSCFGSAVHQPGTSESAIILWTTAIIKKTLLAQGRQQWHPARPEV